jgi:hypothetical protein
MTMTTRSLILLATLLASPVATAQQGRASRPSASAR